MSFILSEDLREKEYFEKWHQSVIGTGAFEGESGYTDFYGGGTMTRYTAGYWDDYTGTVDIRQYGEAGDLRSIHTLNQAYPIILGGVAMNWADESIAKLTVTFAYRNYKCVFQKQDQPGLGLGFALRLDKTGLAASVRGALGSIGFDNNIGTNASIDLGKVGKIAKSANLI
jgi:hypothetical protein